MDQLGKAPGINVCTRVIDSSQEGRYAHLDDLILTAYRLKWPSGPIKYLESLTKAGQRAKGD